MYIVRIASFPIVIPTPLVNSLFSLLFTVQIRLASLHSDSHTQQLTSSHSDSHVCVTCSLATTNPISTSRYATYSYLCVSTCTPVSLCVQMFHLQKCLLCLV
jgi:hypothetical protein